MRDYFEKNFKYKNYLKFVYIIKCIGIFKNLINFK